MLADTIQKIAQNQRLKKDGDTGYGVYRPRPSNAGPDKCIRQLVYHGMGMPAKALPGRAVLIFDDSSWHEELTMQWVEKSAYKIHSRQMAIDIKGAFPWRGTGTHNCSICKVVVQDRDSHGHIDFIITDLIGKDWLVEHKAINHFTFNKIWDHRDIPLDYLTQIVFYFRGIRKGYGITRCLLLIKNKNTSQYIEYELQYDRGTDKLKVIRGTRSDGVTYKFVDTFHKDLYRNAIVKFRQIDVVYIKRKKLPKRPYPFDTEFPCGYCAWKETCWAGYEKEFMARKNLERIKDKEFFDKCSEYLKLTRINSRNEKRKKEIKEWLEAEMRRLRLKEATTFAHTVTVELNEKKVYERVDTGETETKESLSIEQFSYARKDDNRDRRAGQRKSKRARERHSKKEK